MVFEKWDQMGANDARRIFFLLIQTLPTFWAERIWILRIFIFGIFLGPKFLAWAQLGPTHLGPAWAHPLGPGVGPPTWAQLGPTHMGPAWAHPRGPTHPRGPSVGPPTWAQRGPTHLGPDAAGAGAACAGQILRSKLDPSPNAPRDQMRRKEPLLRRALSF